MGRYFTGATFGYVKQEDILQGLISPCKRSSFFAYVKCLIISFMVNFKLIDITLTLILFI